MENTGTWGSDKAGQKERTEDFFKWVWGRRGGKEEARAVKPRLIFTKGSLVSPSITESISQGHCRRRKKGLEKTACPKANPLYPARTDLVLRTVGKNCMDEAEGEIQYFSFFIQFE